MPNGAAIHDSALDGHTLCNELRRIAHLAGETDFFRLDKSIVRPAKSQIVAYGAQSRHIHHLIETIYIRRHILKGDTSYLPVFPMPESRNQACRGIDTYAGYGIGSGKQARFERHSGYCDDPVAAHGAVAFVVQKQDPEIRFFRDRFRKQASVHVRMAAGLPHERPAEIVQALLCMAPSGQNGIAFEGRVAVDDHAQRFARRMRIDHGNPGPLRGRFPAGDFFDIHAEPMAEKWPGLHVHAIR